MKLLQRPLLATVLFAALGADGCPEEEREPPPSPAEVSFELTSSGDSPNESHSSQSGSPSERQSEEPSKARNASHAEKSAKSHPTAEGTASEPRKQASQRAEFEDENSQRRAGTASDRKGETERKASEPAESEVKSRESSASTSDQASRGDERSPEGGTPRTGSAERGSPSDALSNRQGAVRDRGARASETAAQDTRAARDGDSQLSRIREISRSEGRPPSHGEPSSSQLADRGKAGPVQSERSASSPDDGSGENIEPEDGGSGRVGPSDSSPTANETLTPAEHLARMDRAYDTLTALRKGSRGLPLGIAPEAGSEAHRRAGTRSETPADSPSGSIPGPTRAERIEALDRRYYGELSRAESERASGGSAASDLDGGSSKGGIGRKSAETASDSGRLGSRPTSDLRGDEKIDRESEGSSEAASRISENDEMEEGGRTGDRNRTSMDSNNGNSPTPKDIPAVDNDDEFARQIRRAAEAETDPVRKRKLWDEYRRYKGLPTSSEISETETEKAETPQGDAL